MSSSARLKREPPRRSGPIRNMGMAFRPAGAGEAEPPVIDRAVATAYRVIDEYMQRGQKAADRYSHSAEVRGPMKNDTQDMATMAMQYWMSLAQMWFGAMAPFLPKGAPGMPGIPGMPNMPFVPGMPFTPDTGGSWDMGGPEPGVSWPSPRTTSERIALAVEVSSAQPAEVTVILHDPSATQRLVAQSLRAIGDEGKPPLSAIRFDQVSGHLRVRVAVPPDQPEGVYTGAIIDEEKREARGTLQVVIRRHL